MHPLSWHDRGLLSRDHSTCLLEPIQLAWKTNMYVKQWTPFLQPQLSDEPVLLLLADW